MLKISRDSVQIVYFDFAHENINEARMSTSPNSLATIENFPSSTTEGEGRLRYQKSFFLNGCNF